MPDKEREIRRITMQMRASEDKESRQVEGYAALFEVDSQLLGGWFTERIARGAFDGVIEQSDVLCVINHDSRRGVLARCRQGSGSLSLEIDDKGLRYSFEAPRTALGDELLESLRRGDITESSFAFWIADDHWEERKDGQYHRTILKFDRLFDVSPVYEPAYKGTEVFARSLDSVKEELRASKTGDTADISTSEEEKEKKNAEKLAQEKREKHFCGVRSRYN